MSLENPQVWYCPVCHAMRVAIITTTHTHYTRRDRCSGTPAIVDRPDVMTVWLLGGPEPVGLIEAIEAIRKSNPWHRPPEPPDLNDLAVALGA